MKAADNIVAISDSRFANTSVLETAVAVQYHYFVSSPMIIIPRFLSFWYTEHLNNIGNAAAMGVVFYWTLDVCVA